MALYRVEVGPLLQKVLEIEAARRKVNRVGEVIRIILEEVCAAHLVRNSVGENAGIKIPFGIEEMANETFISATLHAVDPENLPATEAIDRAAMAARAAAPRRRPIDWAHLRQRRYADKSNDEVAAKKEALEDLQDIIALPLEIVTPRIPDEELADGGVVETTEGERTRNMGLLHELRALGYTIETLEDFNDAICDQVAMDAGLPI